MYWCNGKGVLRCVLCREVVPFSEGPLSEVPLYVCNLTGGKIDIKPMKHLGFIKYTEGGENKRCLFSGNKSQ